MQNLKMKPSRIDLLNRGVPEETVQYVEEALGLKKGHPFPIKKELVLEGYLTNDEPPVRLWRYLLEGDDDMHDPVFGRVSNIWHKLFWRSVFIEVKLIK